MNPLSLLLCALASAVFITAKAAAPAPGAAALKAATPAESSRAWTAALLQDAAAWPHSEKDARLAASPQGLRVEVAEGRKFAIAAASRLALPKDMGRIRVRVPKVGGNATWFIRLYGELREPGRHHTVGVAQDEAASGDACV